MEKTKEQLVEELGYQAQAIEEKDKKIAELEEKVKVLEEQYKVVSEGEQRRVNELNELIGLFKNTMTMFGSTMNLTETNFNSLLEKITK